MTEQEYRELFRKDCDEKMKPLVEQVTNLVMKAYEYGLDLGLSTANQVIESKQSDWKDQHPMKGFWVAEKVIDYIYNHAHVRTFGDIVIDDMSVTEFIETMKKAMEE